VLGWVVAAALDVEAPGIIAAAKRYLTGQCRVLDARQPAYFNEHAVLKCSDRGVIAVGGSDERELHRQDAGGVEAGIHAHQGSDGPQHETGAREEHQREGEIDGDQQLPCTLGLPSAARPGVGRQHGPEIERREAQRRDQPERKPRHHGQNGGERQDTSIDRQALQTRDGERCLRRQRLYRDRGENNAEHTTARAENDALSQHLPD
jgi:hypothetical protein